MASILGALEDQPRGLRNFISDIRSAKSKEEEIKRVDKELGNIRKKFANSSALKSYDKKKYVWKMCYIYILGYDVDFGHMEMISLLSSTKFSEKNVGYMAVSLLLKPTDEMMTLVVNSMRNDVLSQYHPGQTLALSAIANIGNVDIGESLSSEVEKVMLEPKVPMYAHSNSSQVLAPPEVREQNRALLRKKSSLCLLGLYRANPDCVDLVDWKVKAVSLLDERDMGALCSILSLLIAVAAETGNMLDVCVKGVVSLMNRLVVVGAFNSQDYTYYKICNPWLQVKCLRFLSLFRPPIEPNVKDSLLEVMRKLLIKSDSPAMESGSKCNAEHSVLTQAISLLITYGQDSFDARLYQQAMVLLGRFIAGKDANIRYLGLDALVRLARQDGPASVQSHQATVMTAVKDADVSVRRRALELLFLMTDTSNALCIVEELLLTLPTCDPSIKEEMIVKIAVLSERFASDMSWYLDTMISAIILGGDCVSEDIWFRIVQVVMANATIQEYAAEKLLGVVQSKWCHETAVALAAYILGEFGVNICEQEGMSGVAQFYALQSHFSRMSLHTQGLLLTTYVKLVNLYPDCKEPVEGVFRHLSVSGHLDLQQRACEYLRLMYQSTDLLETVLNSMPPYPEDRQSPLMARLQAAKEMSSAKTGRKGSLSVDQIEENKTEKIQSAPKQTDLLDLLSLDDPPPPPPSSSSLSSSSLSLSSSELSNTHTLLQSLLVSTSPGSLFDARGMKVLYTAEVRGAQARVLVGFQASGEEEIREVKISLQETPGLSLTPSPALPLSLSLSPGQPPVRLTLHAEILSIFSLPTLSISFLPPSSSSSLSFSLSIPSSLSFSSPS